MSEEEKETIENSADEKKSREFYDKLNSVYNNVEAPQEGSILDSGTAFSPGREQEQEQQQEQGAGTGASASDSATIGEKKVEKKPETSLADVVPPETGVILIDNAMSTISSTIYNVFAKGHKSSPQDWALSQAQMNGLYPVTKQLMEHIKVRVDNPYYAFLGVLAGMYMVKASEVKAHYKSGTKLRKEADTEKMVNRSERKKSTGGRKYIKKYLNDAEGHRYPNPENEFWKENPSEFELAQKKYNDKKNG